MSVTDESQLHLEVETLTASLRLLVAASAAKATKLLDAGEYHDAGFEMGKQAGLLLAIGKLESALAGGV